jgi:hypothetical protein
MVRLVYKPGLKVFKTKKKQKEHYLQRTIVHSYFGHELSRVLHNEVVKETKLTMKGNKLNFKSINDAQF